jgi:hypothetical protein
MSVLRIQSHDDTAGKGLAGASDQLGLLDRLGTDDAVGDAGVQVGGDRTLVPDAAPDLDRQIRIRGGDGADGVAVHRLSGEGPVQIHQVQPARARRDPASRQLHRIIREDRLVLHPALAKTHATPVLEIDRGNEQHGAVTSG